MRQTLIGFAGAAAMVLSACWPVGKAAGQPSAGAWDALSEVKSFTAAPEKVRPAERPRDVDQMAGRGAIPGYSSGRRGNEFFFRVQGNLPEVRTMRWDCPLPEQDATSMPYYVLRYRARGQRRNSGPLAVVAVSGANAKSGAVTAALLDCAQVINDGLWHVVVGKKAMPMTVKSLQVLVSTYDSEATLEIAACAFHAELPQSPRGFAHRALADNPGKEFRLVDLSALFNDRYGAAADRTLKAHGMFVDGGSAFSSRRIGVDGIPFEAGPPGKNIIRPPSDPEANKGTVNVLGTELRKDLYKREARDDTIEIPVSGKAAEACFILVAEMPPTINRYALPNIPLQLHNSDAFVVELVYADGESDLAYPYSIADRGHMLQRMTGAYAVPVDPKRELKAIVFHNMFFKANFSVAAVTLSTGAPAVVPESVRQPAVYRVRKVARPQAREPRIMQDGDSFTVQNGDFELLVDCRNGLSIRKLVHRWAPQTEIVLDDSSGLEVIAGERVLTGRAFRTENVLVSERNARIELRCKEAWLPLRITIDVAADSSPQLKLNATATNIGDEPIRVTLRFPVLKGLKIGGHDDTWMYFPQCRNVCTNESGSYLAPNDRPFPMQFFDVFNPKAGIGLALMTHNLDHAVMDYSVRKSEAGVTAFVQYPDEYHEIQPGETLRLTETCLVAHGGDWHEALAAYQEWAATWHNPVKAQDLDWWHRSFALRGHLTSRAYSWAVPIFDKQNNRYVIEPMIKEDRGYLGVPPEIYHMGGWIDLEKLKDGDYLGGDFYVKDYTGGPDVLRRAIRKLQNENVNVSLYTIPDRCAKVSDIGRAIGEKAAQRRRDGAPSQDAKNWYLCLGYKPWQDHYVEALKRSQRETGANAVYVDVFGYTRGYACYSKEHGHEVPLNVNKACNELIRRLRDELPAGVAIWSEFLLTDVNSQYTSGNITYYFLTLHEYMVKSYDQSGRAPLFSPPGQSVHRFAFPHVKQFGFPVGFEHGPSSHELRFLFFNGEGLMDTGWLLYDSRDLARVRNWLAIQQQYADCFSSRTPRPLVPTEAGQIYANEFPGDGRTAWTLFNGRFATYRGPVLATDHRNGDTYHDAWNHRDVSPRIADGKAVIHLKLDPQGLGCVIRTRKH